MVTIISGTNRKFSKTLVVAQAYEELLKSMGIECQLLTMEQLPRDFAFTYLSDPKPDEFTGIMDKYIRPVEKIIAIVPEYQSTFPGIFKLFLDAIRPKEMLDKKVALVGVSTGRAGNLRGLDHLTAAFHYLNVHVYPNKLPISGIQNLLSPEFQLKDEGTLAAMKNQLEGFLKY